MALDLPQVIIPQAIQPTTAIVPTAIVPGAPPVNSLPNLPVDPTSDIPPILQQLGFIPAGGVRMRLFVSCDGEPGSGKTEFLRTMPGPIGVMDFDRGMEGVIDRDLKGRTISRQTFYAPQFDDDGGRNVTGAEWVEAKREYERFKRTASAIIRSGQVRTLAVDTGTAAYALAQAARFGKIAMVGQVEPQAWTAMQQEFERIFLEAYDFGLNVYVIHRQGAKFKGMAGEKELKGYKQIMHLSQVHLVFQKKYSRIPAPTPQNPAATKEVPELSIKVRKSRARMSIDGMEFPIVLLGEDPATGRMQSIGGKFVDVATAVFPMSKPSDWE